MKVHINLANVTVVLVVLLLSGLLVHLGSSRLLGRGSRDNTAAFVFLVGPDTERENRTRGLGIALHTLYHHYQVLHTPRPVILFYGNDIPPAQYAPEVIESIVPEGMASLVEVVVLANFTELADNMRTVTLHQILARDKYPGYHNMCRWNLFGMVQHPRISNLQYYARMDSDSRFTKPVEYDIFETMAERGLHYGYTQMASEAPGVAKGMWNFAEDYVYTHFGAAEQARLERNQFFGNLSIGLAGERFQMVKNEFEVVHVPRFREPDIVQFADAVDVTHRIYTHRWGDSPLRWIECLIFLEMGEEVAHLNVHYTQDKMNSWKVPASWGLAGEQLAV